MAKHKPTAEHFTVLLLAQDGESDFGPRVIEAKYHSACLDLLGWKFDEPLLEGENTRTITGLTKKGEEVLAKYLSEPA